MRRANDARRATVIGIAACALVSSLAITAHAQPPPTATTTAAPPVAPGPMVSANVVVIVAREIAGAIDPRLVGMRALREPPFTAFRSMDIFQEYALTLVQGVPITIHLPNGRLLQIALEEITADGRNRVRVSINRREQADYLPVLEVAAPPGDPFFVAGQSFMGGTLVIGVTLGRRDGVAVPAPSAARPH